jgi:predicted transcriptional regulator
MPEMLLMRPRHPKTVELIEALKVWCSEGHGRQSELARYLEVSPSLVNDWIAGRRTPSLDQGFHIQDFLKKQRRSRKALGD